MTPSITQSIPTSHRIGALPQGLIREVDPLEARSPSAAPRLRLDGSFVEHLDDWPRVAAERLLRSRASLVGRSWLDSAVGCA